MKKYKFGLITAALLLVAGLLAACGDATATVGNSSTTATVASTTSGAGATTTGGAATTMAAGATTATAMGTTMAGATTSAAGTGTTAATAMTTSAANTTAASGTGTTPAGTAMATSPASAFNYPNSIGAVALKPELEKTFAQTFASNLSNPIVQTFTTADDPAKVVTFYTEKLTGLGYTTVTNNNVPNPLQNGLKGQIATFSCPASASTTGCGMALGVPTTPMPAMTMTPGTPMGNTMTANGVQLVAIGPLDAVSIGLLSTQAPDLASALKAGNSIVMVFSGGLNAPRP